MVNKLIILLLVFVSWNSVAIPQQNVRWDIPYGQLPQKIYYESGSKSHEQNTYDYRMALLNYIYPQIVNSNIGFIRLRKTVDETKSFTLSMRQICNRYQLHCKQNNFKEKLEDALTLIKPSEVMAHMIMRSDWLNDGYNTKMNNWFNLLCNERNCGLSLVDQNEKKVQLKSFRNPNAGIYAMMKEIIKDSSLHIDKNQSWKVTKIDNYRRVLKTQYSYNDFMSIAQKYNLAAFDKEMLRHFSTLPLWKWPQLRAYHNKL